MHQDDFSLSAEFQLSQVNTSILIRCVGIVEANRQGEMAPTQPETLFSDILLSLVQKDPQRSSIIVSHTWHFNNVVTVQE